MIFAFSVRHAYRPGIWLGRNGAPRDWPMFYPSRKQAKEMLEEVHALLRSDWIVVKLEVKAIE